MTASLMWMMNNIKGNLLCVLMPSTYVAQTDSSFRCFVTSALLREKHAEYEGKQCCMSSPGPYLHDATLSSLPAAVCKPE